VEPSPLFLIAVGAVGVVAGATAAVSGFGIGSLLTPLFALRLGGVTAVAAVIVPHALATALRAWRLRRSIDWSVLRRFGVLSAAGGLAGSLLFARLGGATLLRVLGALLVLTALSVLTGWAERVRLRPFAAWPLGFLSGFFGGVAGNQGGLRAAVLLGFGLAPAAFVATSTATGLLVDAARAPLYFWRAGDTIAAAWAPVLVASTGVVVGTLLGERLLLGLPAARFQQLVAVLVGLLGVWLLAGAS
jgi:uncharacterized membrane protein YfcA